ncbi:MAG TPA: biotin/lipoyl-containing protein [Flavobacteriaceae bacterium]|nr:biotin/lipoyl-containing protein [Flavobacteriaceae bacterium]
MDKHYKIKAGAHEFEFKDKEPDSLDIQQIDKGKYHVLKNQKSFKAEISTSDFHNKKYSVKINSNTYEVIIFDELAMLIEKMGLSLGTTLKVNDINAPMPGLILDVDVQAGDEVKEGDSLLVLEAMKMENTLTAPRDGVVKSVSVEKGQTVDKNQLLIEME